MPCDSIQLNSLDVGKMHADLLRRALQEIGAVGISQGANLTTFMLDGARCSIRDGRLTLPAGAEHLADRIKVGYSRQVIRTSAAKNGWRVKEVKPNVFQVVK